MSKCSRNGMRFQWVMTLAALLVLPNCLVAQEDGARLGTFDASTGEITFAISLQPQLATPAEVQPAHVVIFVDTSASQNGLFRDDARKALKNVLQGLDPHDKVQLLAIDLDAVPLTSDFVAPNSSEMSLALEQLDERLPLGSTNMAGMLESAVTLLSGNLANKNVIYIGDGISRGALISVDRAGSMVTALTQNRIAVSSFAIGPERDVDTLATLANQTGGNVFIDTDDIGSSDQAAAGLVTTVRGSVFWPTQITPSDQITELFPLLIPPLRNDRDTILVGTLAARQSIDISMTGTIDGEVREISWNAEPEASDGQFRFLPELLARTRENGGQMLPTVGSSGLREMARVILASSHQITPLGSTVLASSVQDDGEDPAEVPAAPVEVPATADEGLNLQDTAPVEVPAGGGEGLNLVDDNFDDAQFLQESAGSNELLNSVRARNEAGRQRLETYVNNELQVARGLMSSDPDLGIERLKAMLDTVQRAPDLEPETRLAFENRLRSALQQSNVRKQEFDTLLALSEEGRAIAESQLNLLAALRNEEEKIAQYLNQFESLMDERNFDGALATVKEAVDAYPSSPHTTAAEEVSIMETNWELYWDLRNQKNRNFLANLYEVERSAVPFSGNPPLVFPDADEWIAKKERRKKFRNVRFAGNEREEHILAQLDRDVKMDYFEQRFDDVLEEIRTDYEINIDLHESAIENSLDQEALITRTLSGITLRSALRIILEPYQCTYMVEDEVLKIVSIDYAIENPVINIYNVADLVAPRNVGGGFGGGGQGGGQGGGGGGGFGGGGGAGGGGGGVFCITDEPDLIRKKDVQKPVALVAEPVGSETVRQAWTRYFANHQAAPADVRETVRSLMKQKKSDDVIAVIEGCMRNDQSQEWMFQAIMLAMQISGASTTDIERTVMSSVDFSDNPDDLMNVALFMTANGMEKRALQVLKYISETNPARHEPYALAMRAARAIGDHEGMKWAVLGVLGQEWPEFPQERKNAFLAAQEIKLDLTRNGHLDELNQFESQLADALYRDCVIKVSWTGEADLDLYVQEPGGTICSRENRRTMCGGIMMGDQASRPNESGQVSEYYVAPKGFAGDYRLAVRRVWGEVPTGKVTVEIYRNYRTPQETSMKRQVQLDDKGAIVFFNLDRARRTEKLNPQAIQTAAAVEFMADRGLMAQQLASYEWNSASRRYRSDNPESARAKDRLRNNLRRDVGFRPEITTFPVGTGMTVQASTADRLYVIVSTPFQLFSDITEVSTFNFVTGDTGTGGGVGGGAGGGAGGAGGAGGGVGF